MAEKQKIISTGYILKKEKLASFSSDKRYSQLVLVDLDPFPGSYNYTISLDKKTDGNLHSVFLILNNLLVNNESGLIRKTMHIKHESSIEFDAAMAFLEVFHKPVSGIRLLMEDFEQLQELIDRYLHLGILFQPYKEVKPYQSLIEVRKFFEMEITDEGIYRDLNQNNTFYLRLPAFLEWDEFERVTIRIRNTMNHKLYDAAQAAIYEKSGMVDLVRIYDKKADLEMLIHLRLKYISEIAGN